MSNFIFFSENINELKYLDNELNCNCNDKYIEMIKYILNKLINKKCIKINLYN